MPEISKISGVGEADVAELSGVDTASIEKVNAVDWPDATTYLLDTYTGAELAFSFRQLSSTATNCIEVVNDSRVAADIGFSAGYLDLSALASHCGSGDGKISKWWDQSGNGRHATQATSSKMPLVFDSGAAVAVNGKTAASFDGGDRLVTASAQVHTGAFYATCTVKTDSSIVNGQILGQDDAYTPTRVRIAQYLRTGSAGSTARVVVFNTAVQNFADNSNAIATNTQLQISSYATSSGTIEAFDNSATNGSSSYTGTLKTGSHELSIGSNAHGSSPAAYFTGHIQEVILWDGDQSSNRSAIESDVDTYYSIP